MEPPDVQFVGICHGHTQRITCMVLDLSSGQASRRHQQHFWDGPPSTKHQIADMAAPAAVHRLHRWQGLGLELRRSLGEWYNTVSRPV